jgi:hypothetical protein
MRPFATFDLSQSFNHYLEALMHRRFAFFIFSLIIFIGISNQSFSLERDFVYRAKERNLWTNEACINFLDQNISLPKHLDLGVVPILKKHQKTSNGCVACQKPLEIYAGYFLFRYQRGYPFLNNQINFAKKYPKLQAYWPETSEKAEKINTVAIKLFKELFTTTVLSKACWATNLQNNFPVDSTSIFYQDLVPLLPVALISQCFRFSDYYVVCKDLQAFAKKSKKKCFSEKEYWQIVDKINDILVILSPLFEEMYRESLALHFTEEMQDELYFLRTFSNRYNVDLPKEFYADTPSLDKSQVRSKKTFSIEHNYSKYEVLLNLGTILNESNLYSDAIVTLTRAIELEKDKTDLFGLLLLSIGMYL